MSKDSRKSESSESTYKSRLPEQTGPEAASQLETIDALALQRAVDRPGFAAPNDILSLQRAAGNHAVSRLIQTKLTVGPAGDKYEQEADAVAEKVLRMPAPGRADGPPSNAGAAWPDLQRQEEDEEELAQPKLDLQRLPPAPSDSADDGEQGDKPAGIQRAARSDGSFQPGHDFERSLSNASGGSPLPGSVRNYMEPRFGSDFSNVRVHTGNQSAQLNRDIGAQAFTRGSDVFFDAGKYNPGTTGGNRLLAHELTHVVQQGGAQAPAGAEVSVSRRPVDEASELDSPRNQVQSSALVQRAPEPAVVTSANDVGLHKFNVGKWTKKFWKGRQGADVGVRSGGLFGTGISQKIPSGSVITKDEARPGTDDQYVWTRYNGAVGFVKKQYLGGERIGNSSFYLLPSAPGFFRIYDNEAGQFVTENKQIALRGAIRDTIGHIVQAEATNAIAIEDKPKLINDILHQAELGTELDPDLWEMATGNIQAKILPRVQADRAQLIANGLITDQHQVKSIEFTGADFHKHGQAPVFIRFETNDPNNRDPRKIVYKPGNLSVDAKLFGKQDSFANTLDPDGRGISQYAIIPREDDQGEKYGFMEFVRSGVPTNQDELLGVYESLAANMALSYVVGLEDVHHENVLLLRDRVQVIDMEATTGLFTTKRQENGDLDLTQGGFKAQLWTKALAEGIKPKLQKAANDGTLQSAPLTDTAVARMGVAFVSTLEKYIDNDTLGDFAGLGVDLEGMHSRVVPIATSDFYYMLSPAKFRDSLQAWRKYVNGDPDDLEHDTPDTAHGAWLVSQSRGQSGASLEFIRRVMSSEGTYNALHRGEIPYYSRDLGSSRIFDEEGNEIDPTGFRKVGRAIDVEIEDRFDALFDADDMRETDAFKLFNAQILSAIRLINDELRDTIG